MKIRRSRPGRAAAVTPSYVDNAAIYDHDPDESSSDDKAPERVARMLSRLIPWVLAFTYGLATSAQESLLAVTPNPYDPDP